MPLIFLLLKGSGFEEWSSRGTAVSILQTAGT